MEPAATPPQILPASLDRRVFQAIQSLPHTPQSDRYISMLSDMGEGMGWVRRFGNRDVLVVGIRTGDASFHWGHTAASFAAVAALSSF